MLSVPFERPVWQGLGTYIETSEAENAAQHNFPVRPSCQPPPKPPNIARGTHLFMGIRLWITMGIGMHSSIRSVEMLKAVAKIMCL